MSSSYGGSSGALLEVDDGSLDPVVVVTGVVVVPGVLVRLGRLVVLVAEDVALVVSATSSARTSPCSPARPTSWW
ncbi:hypothetical protein [Amycolatopsis tucumanensis]|uniref:hypothetical protein n=1 Tax=Amycolatopsis tucumanensis TaxID=401106 RepID=UPI003D744BB6